MENKKLEEQINIMINDTYDYYCVTKPGASLENAIRDAVIRGYKLGKNPKATLIRKAW